MSTDRMAQVDHVEADFELHGESRGFDSFISLFCVDRRPRGNDGLYPVWIQKCPDYATTIGNLRKVIGAFRDGLITDFWWGYCPVDTDVWYAVNEAEAVLLKMLLEIDP